MKIVSENSSVQFENGVYTLQKENVYWQMPQRNNEIKLKNDRFVSFSSATSTKVSEYSNGCGKGIKVQYRDFRGVNFAFDTIVWIEDVSGDFIFEWLVVNEKGYDIKEIAWPSAMQSGKEGYSLIPYMQGVLLPYDYDYDWRDVLPFDGKLCSSAAYMPWFAQVEKGKSYLLINETPWDAKYNVKHDGKGNDTLQMYMLPSLDKMIYKRIVRVQLYGDVTPTTIAKAYRCLVKDRGNLVTLKEKAILVPQVMQLLGSSFIHTKIKTQISAQSRFYTGTNKDNTISSFLEKVQLVESFKKQGIHKLYMHLDGWAQAGYDNEHPDNMEVCEEAGGVKGLQTLKYYLSENGMLLGLHDQYRDYYHKAKSYDKTLALQNSDGSYTQHALWAGGVQNYLCAQLAPYYVKRNYTQLKKQGIQIDASYLDVFTCNELDECANPLHTMTRYECMQKRNECFQYLMANTVMSSSEECSDWAIPSLVFAHYGPYEFMLKKPNTKKIGIPIPLFNLVYHDCIILPWMSEKHEEDYMLYALLNGGAPYLLREAAYANVDGAYLGEPLAKEEHLERCKVVSAFHEEVALEEMINHEFVDGNYDIQKTTFASGKSVIVNLKTGEYTIK